MEKSKVSHVANKLIGHLSKGYRQRVGLADALVARPPILILDEPTAGLDPNQIREVRSLICELGREHAVLLSSHILPEVEATCDRALVISKGELVAEGSIDDLRKLCRSLGVRVTVHQAEAAKSLIEGMPEVGQVDLAGEGVLLVTWKQEIDDVDRAIEQIAETVVAAGAACASWCAPRPRSSRSSQSSPRRLRGEGLLADLQARALLAVRHARRRGCSSVVFLIIQGFHFYGLVLHFAKTPTSRSIRARCRRSSASRCSFTCRSSCSVRA